MAGVTRARSVPFLSATSQTTSTGALSGDLIYTQATVTLTAGTWLIFATVGVLNTVGPDDHWVSVYNRTTSTTVAGSYGAFFYASGAAHGYGSSFPVQVTVTASTDFCPQAHRNGATTIRIEKTSNSIAGGIHAIRIS